MTAAARTTPETGAEVPPNSGDGAIPAPENRWNVTWPEIAIAVVAFLGMCVAALTKSAHLLEPDDYAYRASIVALSHGEIVLTNAQHTALINELSKTGSPGIMQWDHLANGSWISEKNPGYPFFAVLFQMLGFLKITPLFYGAVACLGLFAGARQWLGKWAGTYAVILFCFSGAALAFAWRSTMPTFTDAALIAAGSGGLLWSLLAANSSVFKRTLVGILSSLAFDGAVFIRYTNVVILIVALAALLLTFKSTKLPKRFLLWCLSPVVLFGIGVGLFNKSIYGGFFTTGYSKGEITFSTSAIVPNLEHMPYHLVRSIPMAVLALISIFWIVVRLIVWKSTSNERESLKFARRDAVIGGFLTLAWAGIWFLYFAYDWTAQISASHGQSIHVIRFYVPALGLIALLATWFLTQLPRWMPPLILAVVIGLGLWSYQGLVNASGPGGGPGGFPGGLPGGPGGFPGGGSTGNQFPPGFKPQPGMQPPSNFKLPNGMKLPFGAKLPNGMKLPYGAKLPNGMKLPNGQANAGVPTKTH